MKKSIYFLILFLFAFISCEQEEVIGTTSSQEQNIIRAPLKGKMGKVDVCHKGHIININENALEAHLNHGDVSLIDYDGDGYVEAENECGIQGGDCDDTDPDVNPSATEICDGIDNNCDGNIDEGVTSTFYADADVDGFGDADNSIEACSETLEYVSDNTDCDDNNDEVNPGMEEICDNGIDDNCNGETDEGCDVTEGVFIDSRDGKEYKWVKIGNQIWMAENLAYKRNSVNFALYRGGIADYAHLYTWNSALNNCCPDGWHLPSDAEWTELSTFLVDNGYGYGGSGDDIAQSMTVNSLWGPGLWPGSPNYGVPGADPSLNNTSGFSALPAGFGYKPGGDFFEYPTPDLDQIFSFPAGNSNPGENTEWWSSTKQHGTDEVYTRGILRFDPTLNRTTYNSLEFVFSVRCVKD